MTITADFSGGEKTVTTEPLYQWDTGQKLALSGLPQTASDIQVHFANAAMPQAIVKATELVDNLPTCDVPNVFLQFGSAAKARAWVFYRASNTEGYTVRTVLIPVTPRKRPNDYVSPEDPDSQGIVERAIELLEGYEDDLASKLDASAGAVKTENLDDGAVTEEKLDATAREKLNSIDSETVIAATGDYLDAHPELTTTVQDGAVTTDKYADNSLTLEKFTDALKNQTVKDYYTPEMFFEATDSDDTASIQEALNHGVTILSEKEYRISRPISITNTLRGRGFQSKLKWIGSETDDYMLTVSAIQYIEIGDFQIECDRKCSGLNYATRGRHLFENLKIVHPRKCGLYIDKSGATFQNIEVHDTQNGQYEGYHGSFDPASRTRDYDRIGIHVASTDNFLSKTRCWALDVGLMVTGNNNLIRQHKSFVCQTGCEFGRDGIDYPLGTTFDGESQECIGQPFKLKYVTNGYFLLRSDGNGCAITDTMPVMTEVSSEGYDEDGNPVACLMMNGCHGLKIDLITDTRADFSLRKACERYYLLLDNLLTDSQRKNLNCTINICDDRKSIYHTDGFPKLLSGSIAEFGVNVVTYNGRPAAEVLGYAVKTIHASASDLTANSNVTLSDYNDGVKLSFPSKSYAANIKYNLTPYIGKDFAWVVFAGGAKETRGISFFTRLYLTFANGSNKQWIFNNREDVTVDGTSYAYNVYGVRDPQNLSGIFLNSLLANSTDIEARGAITAIELHIVADPRNYSGDVSAQAPLELFVTKPIIYCCDN